MNNLYRKTPIMGWASWNAFRTHINEDLIKKQADALVSTGLKDYGYTYLNMDDGFFGGRDENGHLKFHKERFPNGIKVIADYVHRLGLNAGIYSEAGDKTCGFYFDNEDENGDGVGLYRHEEQDLELYLQEYGFDFIKVDWCGGLRLGLDEETQYTKIGRIIDEIRHRTGRCIVYNICRWQFPGPWAKHVADSWRTGADIAPVFESVLHQIDQVKPLAGYCGPGHVNDLDMMQIGNGLPLEQEKPINMLDNSGMGKIVKNGAVLVDVRTPQEYQNGHLAGAINIPYTDIHVTAPDILEDKTARIIVYCATGKRSSQAARSLEYIGYSNIYCFATEKEAEPQ